LEISAFFDSRLGWVGGLLRAPLLISRGALDRICWFLGVSSTTASYTRTFHWLGSQTRVMASPDWLCNLCSVATTLKVLLSDRLLDPVHLVLVPLPVPHRPLLRLLQCRLKRLHPLHRGPQPLLQLGKLAPQVRVVPDQLLVHLGQLVQVVLEEGDLLLLSQGAASLFRLLTSSGFLHP